MVKGTGDRGQGSGIRGRTKPLAGFWATVLLLLGLAIPGWADYSFRVDENASAVRINKDGSADLSYHLVFFCNQAGQAIDIVDIGIPNGSYSLSSATASVNSLPLSDIRVSEYVKPYGVEVHLGENEIQPGKKGTLDFKIRVETMVYPDTKDTAYASVEFSPTWYGSKYTSGTTDIAVYFVFPEGVTRDEARYHQTPFIRAWVDSSDRVVYLFRVFEASPSTRYTFGASFPRRYVTKVFTPPKKNPFAFLLGFFQLINGCSCNFMFWAFLISIVVLNVVRANRRKLKYLPPKLGIEGVGVKRGLTAVEAGVLEELPLSKLLTMILFGLVKKGVVRVASREPLRLEVVTATLSAQLDKLNPYEKGFTNALGKDGKIDEKELRETLVDLIKSVNDKMRGFSRKETVAYYKTIASQAWDQVSKSETPQVRTETLSENLEWLLMEKESDKRMQEAFSSRTFIVPAWWGHYDRSYSAPASVPSPGGGGMPSLSVPELPGANFANSMVSGMQSFSNRLVGNLAGFTAGVTQVTNPSPVTSSSGRGGGGHSCACACACAGCACACAGGGR